MAHPTIIIGIGSSGLYALEQAQRFHYEAFKKNKPQNVEYLYIETNKDNRVGVTPLPNEIKRVYISLSQMATMVRNLKKEGENKWLPDPNALINAGLGAGGIRACGRLALWGKNDEGDNFLNVLRSIQNAYRNAVKEALVQKPTVFVVGSTTGGTGSGIFLDIAYLIRDLIPDIKELFGLLLIPKNPDSIRNYEVMYANTYSLMRDLAYYNQENSLYKESWPNGKVIESAQPPYELVQFMSQDYNDGSPAIRTLTGLYKMAGLYLFLNISGVREKRMERIVDAAGVMQIKHYNTFGFSALVFPKDQIQEYLATLKSIELLERWIDPQSYFIAGKKYPINVAEIKEMVKKRWDDLLRSAFEVLDETDSSGLIQNLGNDAVIINKNQQSGKPDRFLMDLFTSRKIDNYYGKVRYNLQTSVDKLIEEIHDWFVETLNRTESLSYVREMMKALVDTMGETIKYWTKDLGVNSDTSRWEKVLASRIPQMLKSGFLFPRFKEIGEQDRVLFDRMTATLTMMKMHLLESKLVELGRNMKKEDNTKSSSQDSSKKLPRLSEIEAIVKSIRQTIGKDVGNQDSDKYEISLYKRLSLIIEDVRDDSVPIKRVFKAGSFEQEVENANRAYGNEPPSKAAIIGARDLWPYLNSFGYNFAQRLYNDTIQKHSERVLEKDCVPDFDVTGFISQYPEEGKRIASRGLAGFISIGNDKVFHPSPYLPRFVVGDDRTKIVEVLNLLRDKENFTEFNADKDGILELPDMKNIMVFYEEKSTFNPLKDISYINQMASTYENYPSHIDGMTLEKWQRDRNAHLIEQEM